MRTNDADFFKIIFQAVLNFFFNPSWCFTLLKKVITKPLSFGAEQSAINLDIFLVPKEIEISYTLDVTVVSLQIIIFVSSIAMTRNVPSVNMASTYSFEPFDLFPPVSLNLDLVCDSFLDSALLWWNVRLLTS